MDKMKCWHCKSDLIWGGDHDIEDLDTDEDGILTNLSCSNEKCNTQVEVYHYFDTEVRDHKLIVSGNAQEDVRHFAEGFHTGDWKSDNFKDIAQDLDESDADRPMVWEND